MNKNTLRLKGNYHYENKTVNYYLNHKELEPIKNTNLTPLPRSKYLNEKTKEKIWMKILLLIYKKRSSNEKN